jgi:protein-disulfide isomerase
VIFCVVFFNRNSEKIEELEHHRRELLKEQHQLRKMYDDQSKVLENMMILYAQQRQRAEAYEKKVLQLQRRYDEQKKNHIVFLDDAERDSVVAALYPEILR